MFKVFSMVALLLSFSTAAMCDPAGSIYSREIRREAQEALSFFGFDTGTADGIFGRQTQVAIAAYQSSRGENPTGELSRAGMGNLLERYRNEQRKMASIGATEGLPEAVSAVVEDIARTCGQTAAQMQSLPGFLQSADLNNDGVTDYLVDGSAGNCIELCGAANCSVTAIASTAHGYRKNDFLGYSVTPRTFNCLSDGFCEFSR